MPMNGYDRSHPDSGYGLARHVPQPRQPAQPAAPPPVDPGAPAVTPAAAPVRPSPGQRAQAMLSQRRAAAPAAPPPTATPNLAPPPAAPPVPAPTSLAPPSVAAPAPAPASLAPPQDSRRGTGTASDPDVWAADPRSNPNNTMSVFENPTTHQRYSDFDNPALQATPGGTFVGKDSTTSWNPAAIYTDPSSQFYQPGAQAAFEQSQPQLAAEVARSQGTLPPPMTEAQRTAAALAATRGR